MQLRSTTTAGSRSLNQLHLGSVLLDLSVLLFVSCLHSQECFCDMLAKLLAALSLFFHPGYLRENKSVLLSCSCLQWKPWGYSDCSGFVTCLSILNPSPITMSSGVVNLIVKPESNDGFCVGCVCGVGGVWRLFWLLINHLHVRKERFLNRKDAKQIESNKCPLQNRYSTRE